MNCNQIEAIALKLMVAEQAIAGINENDERELFAIQSQVREAREILESLLPLQGAQTPANPEH